MWDDRSFSTVSFDSRSWLFEVTQAARRFIVRMKSTITKAVSLVSGLD